MLTPKVKHFIFTSETNPPFSYQPGQFITIHFDHQGSALKRSYSLANPPLQDNRIEFAAGYFKGGPGTEFLYNLKQGDTVHISGPYGRLILKEETPKRYIFVATSTGVTPYRAMIPKLADLLSKDDHLELVFLQGVQRREEILYQEEFRAFENQFPQARFMPFLSREESHALNENEYHGYVQHAFPHLDLNAEKDVVYLCGNPDMIDEAFQYLKDQQFSLQHIIREKYISR